MQKILKKLQKQIDNLDKSNKALNIELQRQRQLIMREAREHKKTKSTLIRAKQHIRAIQAKLASMRRI